MKRREFLRGVGAGVVGGAALALGACGSPDDESSKSGDEAESPSAPMQGASLPAIAWRGVTSWTPAMDVLQGSMELLAARVAAMSDGRFQIATFPAGEIVPALGVFDAVSEGTVECCQTVSFYFIDRNEALGIASGVPFGLTPQQQNAWLYEGGGIEAIQKVYADFGIISFPVGNTGTQMGGWLQREINTLEDLQQIRFRIPGLGGRVMQRLGVETVVVPGGEILQAFEDGKIDAAEWVGPYDDEKLGLHTVADYYYYPGWWEPGTTEDLLINRQAWDALPKLYQEILQTAAYEVNMTMLTNYEMKNQLALARLVAGGTQMRAYSDEILLAARNATFALYEETANSNPSFKEVFEPWKEFRKQIYQWNQFNELFFARFATESVF